VSDRIALTLRVLAERVPAIEAHQDLIAAETLALELSVEVGDAAEPQVTVRRVGSAS
jgi:isoleucyl-tRNA synthetase